MPEQIDWDTDSIEELEALEFDDPWDRRRYFEAGDNQIAGVGDGFTRNSAPWIETVENYGLIFRYMATLLNPMNVLPDSSVSTMPCSGWAWIPIAWERSSTGSAPSTLSAQKPRSEAANGLLDGFVIWGDVAYKSSLFFEPDYWRTYFKPWVKAMADYCHDHNLPVIYHGCGNVKAIFQDLIDIGIRRVQSTGGQSGHGCGGIEAGLRTYHYLLWQQQYAGLGIRQTRKKSRKKYCANSTQPKAAV